jgi:hypothetical protein
VVAALLSLSFAAAGSPQQTPPKPAPEMAQLAYFEGSWRCTGKMAASPMGPAGTMTSTADVRKDLNGFFQSGTIKSMMANMPPFEGRFHMTYDAGMKQYVMVWADNAGGWSQTMSTGWSGDAMTFEGDAHMAGQSMKSRDTFTKSGPAAMKHTSEMQMDGKWTQVGEETCTKK